MLKIFSTQACEVCENQMAEFKEHGRHPVVFLTFKDLGETNYDAFVPGLRAMMGSLYRFYKDKFLSLDERIVFKKAVEQIAAEEAKE